MTDRHKDLIFGGLLLGLGLTWTGLVWSTIPPAFDAYSIGPRAFPLTLGFILVGLCMVLLVHRAAREHDNSGTDVPAETDTALSRRIMWLPLALITVEICAYGYLLDKIGFLLATPLVILAILALNLRCGKPKVLVGMALGVTVGCWLIFDKLMGIHLASGSWINLG
ncbi:tripartite tricarboxylate transporter TctB family protein [Salipiger sp. 1_MG-2023]|uniref:tripartite tricarboxylate transporter TctB family protein n=1 Tax=Salipiger sp. 1_MG-2023 TaxID=3062665 RepID=UPI0026E1F12D|nr:tripartite tricarboxylate transporter TctB family protein [Salipiger sp. 1_MG-2023]MDO6588417.1 tripartite tricarboxylate transporter TctB family protein [Salipiger sp. 1_MG-2023]